MSKAELVRVFTDGACVGNPGPGGWACILKWGNHTRTIAGAEAKTTNNRMEMMAAIEGLRALSRPCRVVVVTDSEYLRMGITDWIRRWRENGWRTKSRKPVKNVDLWQQLDALCRQHEVEWEWTKGHAGHPENEQCDRLAESLAERASKGEPAETLRVDQRT